MHKAYSGASLWRRGMREVRRLSPRLLPASILSKLLGSVTPFVDIYFSALILEELSGARDQKRLTAYIALILSLNFILFLLGRILERTSASAMDMLYNCEHNGITIKMLTIDYETLESNDLQEKIVKHKTLQEQAGSVLLGPVQLLNAWVGGTLTIVISLVFLFPLLRLVFKRTGNSFIESPWLGVVLIAAVLVGVGIVLLLSALSNRKTFRLREGYLKINRIFDYYVEMMMNYKTGKEIRVFQEQDLIQKHATQILLKDGLTIQKKMGTAQSVSNACIAVIGAVLGCGVYLMIGLKGLTGLFGLGSVIRYMGSFLQIVQGLTAIATETGRLSSIIPGIKTYFDLMDTDSLTQSGVAPITQCDTIEFRNVSFRYPGADHDALRNVSFILHKGERLAVVGENGSGKTTFIKLMCRLYRVSEGKILLNGIDIQDYQEDEYRKLFSVVFQDFHIFSLPLGQNIAASMKYDEPRAQRCAKESGLDTFAEKLDNGYETFLYKDFHQDGVEISGGEAQKLALARALYRDTPFIILDEPTASLDPIAEYNLYARFDEFVGDKTAVYISHRLSSCRFCSRIAVFEEGRITQVGTHEALIKDEQGKYHELWLAQAQYYIEI